MRSDFIPVHLINANEKLDRHVLAAEGHKKKNDEYKKDVFKESLWKKFLGLFQKRR